MIEVQRCTNKDSWDEFILDNGGHPLQLWSWGQVKANYGWQAERLFLLKDERIVGAIQVLVRKLPLPFRAFAYAPRGPVFLPNLVESDQADLLKAVARLVKTSHHAITLSIEPDLLDFTPPTGWHRSTNKLLSAETLLLDLSKTESDLLAAMAKKTRQYIRKSDADVIIKQAKNSDDIKVCLDIYKQTAKRAGFNLHVDKYYQDVKGLMGDFSPIFIAYKGSEPVSFLWLAISEATAYELYGGMTEQGQSLRANYALKWHAIKKSKEWGIDRYDFGGMVAGGVANFKQGWSDHSTEFAGTFDYPMSPLYVLWSRGLPFLKKTAQTIRRKH